MPRSVPPLAFDLKALEVFLAICEAGTMSAAARALGMTQPAVSQSIAELERSLGFKLLDRDVRPLAVTVAGDLLRQRATALVAEARQIAPMLRQTEHGKLPVIRVGLVDSLTRALSTPLASYLSTIADEVSILSGLTALHAGDLLTRRLDLFLGVDDLENSTGLERWQFAKEPYCLLLPARIKPPRTVAELKKLAATEPLIRFSARSQTGLQIDAHLRRLGLSPPRSLEFDNPYSVTASVSDGRGFAVTTPLCVRESALPAAVIKMAKLPGPQFSRALTLVARHRELGRIPRDISELARKVLSELPANASPAT